VHHFGEDGSPRTHSPTHAPVGYRWQNTESSLISTCATSCRTGKFDTNDLVMTFGALAYVILRWMRLRGLMGEHAPIAHSAKRWRLRTVMQELIYFAVRVVCSARQLTLRYTPLPWL